MADFKIGGAPKGAPPIYLKMKIITSLFCALFLQIATYAQALNQPQEVAFSPNGSFLAISDTGNDRVLLFKRTENGWRKEIAIKNISKPQGIAWFKEDKLAICEGGKGEIAFYSLKRGKAVKETSIGGLRFPTGIAIWRDYLFVADGDADRIVLFKISGYPTITFLKDFGKRGSGKGELSHPTYVAISDDGIVFVADEGNGRVAIWKYNPSSETAEPYDPYALTDFWTCRSLAIAKPTNELWVLSSYSGEIKKTQLSDLKNPQWRIFSGLVEGTQREVTAVYQGHRTPQGYPSKNSIFAEGNVPPVLALGRLGDIFEPVISFSLSPNTGEVAIARGDKVIILPLNPRLNFQIPTRPTINASEKGAIINWETPLPAETIAQIKRKGEDKWTVFSLSGKRKKHSLRIEGLEPATSYLVRIPIPRAELIDDDENSSTLYSFEYAFATQPPKGETTFLRIPVAVLIYSDVIKMDDPTAPPAPPVSRSYLDYLRREIEMVQLFYWCNSNMKLWLDCDLFFINERIYVKKNQEGYDGNGFWRDKPLQDLRELLRLRGRSLQEYPAVVAITCERHWDPQKKQYEFTPSGGGTYGADLRPGSSHFLGGHDPAWLFVHEFHHQLDSQYHESGYPEYPFNHFSITPDGFADNHGSHYDGNAWLLRHWHYGDLSLWFVNKFGEVVSAKDADEDGIPDDCPAVPLDEKRFGSDPNKKDTDGDGLDDMGEVMASSWVYETLVWPNDINARAKYVLPDPKNPDSDGDGVIDGYDPLPIYACKPLIGRDAQERWFWIDEDTSDVPRPYPVPPVEKPLHGDIYLFHNDEWLNFRFVFNLPVPQIHIQMDCNANGYYVGADNLDVWIYGDWQREKASIKAEVNNASSRERWPFSDPSLVPPPQNMEATIRKIDAEHYEITFSIKQSPKIGLEIKSGKIIGLNIEVLAEKDSPRWLCLFQPQQLIPLVIE
ncbi:MAG: hypothetical protein ACPLPS_05280 [bacterium]